MNVSYEISVHGKSDIKGSADLLWCPFCGEEKDIELINTHTPSCWVECGNCGSTGSGEYFSYRNGNSVTKHFKMAIESAIQRWNKRF